MPIQITGTPLELLSLFVELSKEMTKVSDSSKRNVTESVYPPDGFGLAPVKQEGYLGRLSPDLQDQWRVLFEDYPTEFKKLFEESTGSTLRKKSASKTRRKRSKRSKSSSSS